MKTQIVGLLNETLKGIKLITGEEVTEDSARLIMQGILNSIPSKKVTDYFIDYCCYRLLAHHGIFGTDL